MDNTAQSLQPAASTGVDTEAFRAFDIVRSLIVICQSRTVVYVNSAGVSLLNHSSCAEIVNRDVADLLQADYRLLLDDGLEALAEENEGIPVKFELADGDDLDVHLWISALKTEKGLFHVLEGREISSRLRTAAELRVREQRLKEILNAVPDAILSVGPDKSIITANPAAERMFELSRRELVGRGLDGLVTAMEEYELPDLLDSTWERSYQGSKYFFGARASGHNFPAEMVVRDMQQGETVGYICVIRDVTDRDDAERELERHLQNLEFNQKVLEERASEAVYLAEELAMQKQAIEESKKRTEYLARHDPLTELPNRRFFMEFLSASITNATESEGSVCLLYIDLDRFKEVNDRLGHDAGDEVLMKVAKRLRDNVRDSDMVARLGGDEFAVILNGKAPSVGGEVYRTIAERMLKDLRIAVAVPGDEPITISGSFGGAIYPIDAETVDGLLKAADELMYEVKNSGRNRVVFEGD